MHGPKSSAHVKVLQGTHLAAVGRDWKAVLRGEQPRAAVRGPEGICLLLHSLNVLRREGAVGKRGHQPPLLSPCTATSPSGIQMLHYELLPVHVGVFHRLLMARSFLHCSIRTRASIFIRV